MPGCSGLSSSCSRFRNCRFTGNTASGDGGGVYVYGSYSNPALFEDCEFTGNTSSDDGGGMLSSYCIVRRCVFSHNFASDYGGGVYITDAISSEPPISNCLVANNTAYYGGGLYVSSNYAGLESSTIVCNNATYAGGGIYSYSMQMMSNSILWGNRRNGEVSNIEVNSASANCVYSAVENGYPGGQHPATARILVGRQLPPQVRASFRECRLYRLHGQR